jgi:hypothetical protein
MMFWNVLFVVKVLLVSSQADDESEYIALPVAVCDSLHSIRILQEIYQSNFQQFSNQIFHF